MTSWVNWTLNPEKTRRFSRRDWCFHNLDFAGRHLISWQREAGLSNQTWHYFRSEDVYTALAKLLEDWLEPLREINADGDPLKNTLAIQTKTGHVAALSARNRLFIMKSSSAPRIGDDIARRIA
jgi:TetR/AcrR family transcriptional regulator